MEFAVTLCHYFCSFCLTCYIVGAGSTSVLHSARNASHARLPSSLCTAITAAPARTLSFLNSLLTPVRCRVCRPPACGTEIAFSTDDGWKKNQMLLSHMEMARARASRRGRGCGCATARSARPPASQPHRASLRRRRPSVSLSPLSVNPLLPPPLRTPTLPSLRLPQYMHAHEIPLEVRGELTGYLHLKLMATKEHKEVLQELPSVFRARIFRLVYRPIILKSYLLVGASDAMIDTLACELQHELYMPGMAVVAQYHGVLELNFIVSGTAEVLAEREHLDPDMDEKSVSHAVDVMRPDEAHASARLLKECDCFGEIAFFFSLPQPFTVRTISLCRARARAPPSSRLLGRLALSARAHH